MAEVITDRVPLGVSACVDRCPCATTADRSMRSAFSAASERTSC